MSIKSRQSQAFFFTRSIPSWLEPPPTDPGSVDPLGFLGPAEQIAEQLLPGLTVATQRVRYLSFLCWAIRETAGDDGEIDRWEVALSCGEYLRHGTNTGECRYLGSRLVDQAQLRPGDPLPQSLHQQTARRLYASLLRSCDLCDDSATKLSGLGEKIADDFGRDMPHKRPMRVFQCRDRMPCLSALRGNERRWLKEALIEGSEASAVRKAAFRGIGCAMWREVAESGAVPVLRKYLGRRCAKGTAIEKALHNAARLELQSLPLTRLFLYLYEHAGNVHASIPRSGRFHPYDIARDIDISGLLSATVAHLRLAASLGSAVPGLTLPKLKDWLCQKHHEAKPDGPWVDQNWVPLRIGLQPQRLAGVHDYRLSSFAMILRDLGEI